MRSLPRILIATALSTLALSTLTVATWAADAGDPVKSSRAPYKPGREIDDAGSADGGGDRQSARAADDGADPVKSSRAPYKPGRQADDGTDPVKSSRAPYKQGRQADDGQDAGNKPNK